MDEILKIEMVYTSSFVLNRFQKDQVDIVMGYTHGKGITGYKRRPYDKEMFLCKTGRSLDKVQHALVAVYH